MLLFEKRIMVSYYYANIFVYSTNEKDFFGKIRYYRKDTNEQIYGENIIDNSLEKIKIQLKQKASAFFESREKPSDWEISDSVKLILQEYFLRKEEIDNFFCYHQGEITKEFFYKKLSDLSKIVKDMALTLSQRISELSDEDKARLVTGSEKEYSSIDDVVIFDILSAKTDIYQYVINPSEKLAALHKKHKKKMNT